MTLNRLLFSVFVSILAFAPVQAQKPSKPEKNFEFFWNTFNEYYPSFEIRKVNWQEQYKKYRPLVTANTTDDELFRILNEMISSLKDGNAVISKTSEVPATPKYSEIYKRFPTVDSINQLRRVTFKTLEYYKFGEFTWFNSKKIFLIGGWCTSHTHGYLQLNGFGWMPLKSFEKEIDEMMAWFTNKEAVIIDLRINASGLSSFADALLERFSIGEYAFKKQIVLLTSGASNGIAEYFVMKMMNLSNVTIVGEHTAGFFSNRDIKKMPNGWKFSLPYKIPRFKDGGIYEGIGIPVDIEVANIKNDLVTGKDPVLEKAIDFLNRK